MDFWGAQKQTYLIGKLFGTRSRDLRLQATVRVLEWDKECHSWWDAAKAKKTIIKNISYYFINSQFFEWMVSCF